MILPINPSSLPGNQSVIETSRNCNDLPLKLSLYKYFFPFSPLGVSGYVKFVGFSVDRE